MLQIEVAEVSELSTFGVINFKVVCYLENGKVRLQLR
jgi:hypothetical protein